LTLFIACGIIVEILRHALLPDRRTRTFAKVTCVILFAAIAWFAGKYIFIGSGGGARTLALERLERDFHAVQSLLLLAIFGRHFLLRDSVGQGLERDGFGIRHLCGNKSYDHYAEYL